MNPNMITYDAKAEILSLAIAADGTFDPATIKLYLLAAAQINLKEDGLISKTQPGNGLNAVKTVSAWSAVSRSPEGHAFVTSPLITWLATADPVDETAVGVAIASATGVDNTFAYAAFDYSEGIEYASQPVAVVMEVGFNGKEFYTAARRVTAGE